MHIDRLAPLLIAIKNDVAAIRLKVEGGAGRQVRVQRAGRSRPRIARSRRRREG